MSVLILPAAAANQATYTLELGTRWRERLLTVVGMTEIHMKYGRLPPASEVDVLADLLSV
eukprot:scaffold20736_cov91-Skeletonema_dohrnii-CCMP3373.AAC.1